MTDRFKKILLGILILGLTLFLVYIVRENQNTLETTEVRQTTEEGQLPEQKIEESKVPEQPTEQVTQKTETKVQPNTVLGTTLIKEWGVQYPQTESNKNFTYTFKPKVENQYNANYVSSIEFKYTPSSPEKWDTCKLPTFSKHLNDVSKILPGDRYVNPKNVRKIGEYYYYFDMESHEPCHDANGEMISSEASKKEYQARIILVRNIFDTLELQN